MDNIPEPYTRLVAYLTQRPEDDRSRFNPPGSKVVPRSYSTPPIYVLVLPQGDTARVCMDEDDNVRWFGVQVPDFGLVHIEPDTSLISPIAEKVDAYLSANDL